MNTKRRFIDAGTEDRCQWTIKLRDGSEAQCGRYHVDGRFCTQHLKMAERWSCEYCGSNDELPPDHCAQHPATSITEEERHVLSEVAQMFPGTDRRRAVLSALAGSSKRIPTASMEKDAPKAIWDITPRLTKYGSELSLRELLEAHYMREYYSRRTAVNWSRKYMNIIDAALTPTVPQPEQAEKTVECSISTAVEDTKADEECLPVKRPVGRPPVFGGKRVQVYLDPESLVTAASLGTDGNVSDGIRQALKRVKKGSSANIAKEKE